MTLTSEIAGLIDAYKAAYRAANDRDPPTVIYSRGWFTIDRRIKKRKAGLETMICVLRKRVPGAVEPVIITTTDPSAETKSMKPNE